MDEDALYSIVDRDSKIPSDDVWSKGYVNIIDCLWTLPSEEHQAYLREESPELDPLDEDEELLDGCRVHDVGWMKVQLYRVFPGLYTGLDGVWRFDYVRPPGIGL